MSVPFVNPKTGQITWPQPRRGQLGPVPVHSRRRIGLGDYPSPAGNGAAGPLIYPYTENTAWNTDSGTVTAPPLLQSSTPTGAPIGATSASKAPQFRSPSAPFGESDRPWINPTTFATVPINAATNIQLPVLSLNFARNLLLIQNNSTATAPDTAPFLYIGFNAQPQVGYSLQIQPGQGIFFDVICPRDSVYIAFGPFLDTGNSTVVAGCVIQGTYVPNQSQQVTPPGPYGEVMVPVSTYASGG